MVNLIRNFYEPSSLELAWQAPDGMGNRKRFAVGRLVKSGPEVSLQYYVGTPDVSEATSLGYLGHPAFSIKQNTHTKDVLAAFMRRLPPRARPDFEAYLSALRIGLLPTISDFALLAYSEAKLPSDGFSLVDTLSEKRFPFEFLFEVAGYRYYPPFLSPDDIGITVGIEHEPENPKDSGAVVLKVRGRRIGYINRLQAPAVLRFINHGRVNVVVEKLNGQPEKPRAFVFMQAH